MVINNPFANQQQDKVVFLTELEEGDVFMLSPMGKPHVVIQVQKDNLACMSLTTSNFFLVKLEDKDAHLTGKKLKVCLSLTEVGTEGSEE